MAKNKIIFGLFILICLASQAYAETADQRARGAIRIGISKQITSSVGVVAGAKNFFSSEGLSVEISYFASGKRALEVLTAGEIDVAIGVADVPVVFRSFEDRGLLILAVVGGDSMLRKVIVRRSAGIAKPEDLRGKRIATQENSAVHFFLHVFLSHFGLTEQDVTLSFMKPEELPQALAEKQIDAFSMREPFLSQARDLLGGDAILFELPDLYFSYEMVVTTKAFAKGRADETRKILRGLKLAENFIKTNLDLSVALIAKSLEISEGTVRKEISQVKTRIFMDQGLLYDLEDIARWAVKSKRATSQTIPRFQDIIDTSFLEAIGTKR